MRKEFGIWYGVIFLRCSSTETSSQTLRASCDLKKQERSLTASKPAFRHVNASHKCKDILYAYDACIKYDIYQLSHHSFI